MKKGTLQIEKAGMLIYLICNLAIIIVVFRTFISQQYGIQIGLVAYGLSLLIAFSPLGETCIRLFGGCKRITREDQINKIEPIYHDAIRRANKVNPKVNESIEIFISHDSKTRVKALGRRTLLVSDGTLYRPDDEIKALLGHEIGHICNHDTDWIVMVTMGNFFVTVFFFILQFVVKAVNWTAKVVKPSRILRALNIIINTIIAGIMGAWTKFGKLLVNWSLRENEFKADEFAFNMGLGETLCELIEHLPAAKEENTWKDLLSPFQDPGVRIAHLQDLGCEYKQKYQR